MIKRQRIQNNTDIYRVGMSTLLTAIIIFASSTNCSAVSGNVENISETFSQDNFQLTISLSYYDQYLNGESTDFSLNISNVIGMGFLVLAYCEIILSTPERDYQFVDILGNETYFGLELMYNFTHQIDQEISNEIPAQLSFKVGLYVNGTVFRQLSSTNHENAIVLLKGSSDSSEIPDNAVYFLWFALTPTQGLIVYLALIIGIVVMVIITKKRKSKHKESLLKKQNLIQKKDSN